MSSWTFDRVNINGYQTPPQDLDRTCIPPPAPGDSHVPKDLRSTSFAIGKHPKTDEVVKEVNKFFLDNWPFRTDKHRKRFVNEGYAWFMCITCPMSRNDRIHWGCRLLTLGFLIDDLLDRMSVEEGVTHNSKVIECARGHTVPDPAVPAQWIMYDLFEGMRTIDKHLADELLELTIEFLVAQADGNRMKPMTLQEYFDYRFADLGKGLMSGIMRFCAGLSMSPEDLQLVKAVDENSMKHISFVNDICSFEKEILSSKNGFELGAICSSVPIIMNICGVNEHEAKRIMWQMIRAWEVRHVELVDEILSKHSSPALATYFKGLEYQVSGNERWSLLTPRYNRTGNILFTEMVNLRIEPLHKTHC